MTDALREARQLANLAYESTLHLGYEHPRDAFVRGYLAARTALQEPAPVVQPEPTERETRDWVLRGATDEHLPSERRINKVLGGLHAIANGFTMRETSIPIAQEAYVVLSMVIKWLRAQSATPSQLVEDARRYRAIRPFDAPDEHEDRYVVIKLNGKRTTFYNGSALDAAADAIAKGVES